MEYFNIALFLCCVFLNKSLVFSGVLPKEDLFRLDIVHYNDFHDRFEETSVQLPVCQSNDSQCIGGFPRLYHEIVTLMEQKPDALLLDAGDNYQGTYWYTLFKWNITQTFINLLPNDAHAIGNHEFDDGVAGLAPYLKGLTAPVVAANINTVAEPSLDGLIQPSIVVERRGRRIGIIGLITTDTARISSSEGVIFLDPVECTKREAQKLTDEGIDIIIVLSHCGLNIDKVIAKEAGDNIDLIVGGHSHSLLWNGTSPTGEPVDGPYPFMVESEAKPGHNVLIVTAAAYSKYLGNLTTYFDDSGELQGFEGTPVFLNRSIPEDPEIKAMLQPYHEKLESLVKEVVGYTEDSMVQEPCGRGECAIGNLVAESFLDATKQMNLSSLPHVALIVKTNVRGSLLKGDIMRGDVINCLPFSNKAVTCVLKGKYIIEALDYGIQSRWVRDPFNGPNLLQVAGIRATLNVTEPRVVSVSVKEDEEFHPIDPERDYQVSVLLFIAKGGNGFKMIGDNCRNMTIVDGDRESLEKYTKKISPIVPTLDKRLILVK